MQRQFMLQVLVTAEVLPVRVLQPPRHQPLVAQVERVLQIVQARHQPGRQRRLPRARTVLHVDRRLQPGPVHLLGQAQQGMAEVEDLRQLGTEQIGFVVRFSRLHDLQGIGRNRRVSCKALSQNAPHKSIKSKAYLFFRDDQIVSTNKSEFVVCRGELTRGIFDELVVEDFEYAEDVLETVLTEAPR